MTPNLGLSEIDPNTRFRHFFANFLIILQQQKTSDERDDTVILFSLLEDDAFQRALWKSKYLLSSQDFILSKLGFLFK